MFLRLQEPDTDPLVRGVRVRIRTLLRILLSSSKYSKKNLDSCRAFEKGYWKDFQN